MTPAKKPVKSGVSCAICRQPLLEGDLRYPREVCRECDRRALNAKGSKARHISQYPESRAAQARAKKGEFIDFGDDGDNPVFIDGLKCWRRYRFGGWVTMRGPVPRTPRKSQGKSKAAMAIEESRSKRALHSKAKAKP